MMWEPAVNWLMANDVFPDASSVLDPKGAEPSKKVTVPVGVPPLPDTVDVKMTTALATDGLKLEFRETALLAPILIMMEEEVAPALLRSLAIDCGERVCACTEAGNGKAGAAGSIQRGRSQHDGSVIKTHCAGWSESADQRGQGDRASQCGAGIGNAECYCR